MRVFSPSPTMPLVSKSSCLLSIESNDALERQCSTLDAALGVREAGAGPDAPRDRAPAPFVKKGNMVEAMERTGAKQPAWSTRDTCCWWAGMLNWRRKLGVRHPMAEAGPYQALDANRWISSSRRCSVITRGNG